MKPWDESHSRRSFLKQTSLVLLGTEIMSQNTLSYSSETVWKPAIACREDHLKEVQAPDSWNALKKIGATGTEVSVAWNKDTRKLVCPHLFPPQKLYTISTPDEVKRLHEDLQKNEVQISAFCMHNQFDDRPEAEFQWAETVVKACQTLKVRAIRIDLVPRKLQGEEFFSFAISMGKRLAELVNGTDIRFGIENHGNTTNRPEFLDKLFDGIGSEAVGLTLDTANFYWFGHPLNELYKIYAQFASRTYHTHCKSIRYPEDQRNITRPMGWEYEKYTCPIFEGDIDFHQVIEILRKANYTSDLCIEDESLGKFPKEQREEILQKEVAHLKRYSLV